MCFEHLVAGPGFDTRPHEFVRIELWRIGRQEKQFDAISVGFDKALNELRPVNWMAIDDEDEFLIRGLDAGQPFLGRALSFFGCGPVSMS